ncbi:hypothetical protein JL721_829 [Aureococcus anophagefferens]|nr:hypothetical protein JL721_829 [Aureococcus anophagefferens]
MASALATATSALVTGGALGLGRAAAARIVGAGGTVCIFDFDEEKGKATAKELGASAIFQQGDVRDPAAVAHALEAMVSAFGRVDAAVSCAGIAPPAKTLGKKGPHSLALFEDVLGVNAVGTFNVARLAAAAMANNEPDAAGMRGAASVGQAAYAASKAAVAGMTLPLARDLAPHGIRCVTIAPGLFNTPMMAGLPPHVKDELAAAVPCPKRLGDPDEYAKLVAAIIDNPMLNGETIRLDGAYRMPP